MKTFFYATYIKTTPEKLWKALTSPEFTEKYWWGRRLTSDWEMGSQIVAYFEGKRVDWDGKVLIYEPYKKLSFSFLIKWIPELAGDEPSTVTYDIEPAGDGIVKFTVTHGNLSEKSHRDVSNGWPAIISSLKSLVEGGAALEYADSV